MSLIKKLLMPVKSIKKPVQAFGLAGALFLSSLAGCGGDSSGSSEPPKENKKPTFTLIDFPSTGTENKEYTGIVEVSDPEGDPVEFDVVSGPAGYYVNQTDVNRYEIKFTPDDSQSDATHSFTFKASDGFDHNNDKVVDDNDSSFGTSSLIYIINVETASGNVKSCKTLENLFGIRVEFSKWSQPDEPVYSTWTDANGNWQLTDIPDGEYDVMIKDDNTGNENNGIRYETYVPRPFLVSKAKALENKLKKDCLLLPQADRQFINDVSRLNGMMVKWKVKPKFRIYLRDSITNESIKDVAPDNLLEVRNCIKTDLSQFCEGSFVFTDSDIEEIDSVYPYEGAEGYVSIFWNSSYSSGGGNDELIDYNNYRVVWAYSVFGNFLVGKDVILQELSECMIGGGETKDTAYSDSAFYDSGFESSSGAYSPEDIMIGRMHYYKNPETGEDLSRPGGNMDGLFTDFHDEDVDKAQGYWNE